MGFCQNAPAFGRPFGCCALLRSHIGIRPLDLGFCQKPCLRWFSTVLDTLQVRAAKITKPDIELAANPLVGDVIPGAGGLRKVRWSRAGMGKRGGARVVYFNQLAQGVIALLIVYTKAKFDNLPTEFLLRLKQEFDDAQT